MFEPSRSTAVAQRPVEIANVPLWAWQIVVAAAGVLLLIVLARSVWRPTTRSLRWWTFGNLVVNAGIAVTGATVRVTSSGLGCSEWPRCTPDSFVPVGGDHPALNAAIEFGNRTLTFLVLAVGIIVVVAVWRMSPRRGDLLVMAGVVPVGVLGQAVVGGITVWSGLHPAAVGAHFLLSMAVLVVAVTLYVRCREPRGKPRPTVPPHVRRLAASMLPVGFALLVLGTVTTGTGPHGGDIDAPRWGFDLVTVTRTHSALAWLLLLQAALLLALVLRSDAPRPLRTQTWLLLAALVGQGALGYTQYALGLPAWLVVGHVLGAVVTWIALVRIYVGTITRVARPTPASPGTPATSTVGG